MYEKCQSSSVRPHYSDTPRQSVEWSHLTLWTGRTRVRSKIQTVLIVTKARDNRLIKLTRELALYLMQKRPMNSPEGHGQSSASTQSSFSTNTTKAEDRGMIVYVDAQLRHSKRFDAHGLQRDHPDLFKPVHRRRSSSTTSVNNLSSWSSATSMSESKRSKDEGQLRYWTSEMCSTAPHLFDFVVTVCLHQHCCGPMRRQS